MEDQLPVLLNKTPYDMSLQELMLQFWADKAKSTIRQDRLHFRIFAEFIGCGVTTIADRKVWQGVQPSAIRAYYVKLRADGLSPGILRNRIHRVSAFYRHLEMLGLVPENPVWRARLKLPGPNKQVKPNRALQPKTVRRIFDELSKRVTPRTLKYRAVMALLFGAGLRTYEVAAIRICDFRDNETFRSLYVRPRKTDAGREVRLPAWAWMMVEDWINYRRKKGCNMNGDAKLLRGDSAHSVYVIVRKALKLAGLEGAFRPHEARTTYVTRILENGCTTKEAMASTGHKSIAMLNRYDDRRIALKDAPIVDYWSDDSLSNPS